MPHQYTAAVIGAGQGGKASMAALSASPRFHLAAVADIHPQARAAAQELYPAIRTFPSHDELFAACPTDVVCVSTWPPSHLDVTRAALHLPLKGILVEKPLADNHADGRQLLDLVRAKNLPMVVPHGLLVADHSRQILDRVHGREIGQLKLVEIQCTGWDIINAGIHWLNFFVELTGREPVEYVAAACDVSTRTWRDNMQVETLAVTYAQTASGTRVVMNTGDYVTISEPDADTLFRLIGTLGTIDFYGWAPRYRLLNAEFPQGQLFEVEPGPANNHQRHLENLAAQIDRAQPDYTRAEGSLAALEICEAAYISCRNGGTPVPLPLDAFAPPPPVAWQPGLPYSGHGGGRDGRRLPPRPEPQNNPAHSSQPEEE